MIEPAGSGGERRQKTIARVVQAEGTGLHTNRPARAVLKPAAEGSGLGFRRTDLEGAPLLRLAVESVSSTEWRTVLEVDGAEIGGVEHLAAAASALQIDNLEIELHGPEPPALDGSAAPWSDLLEEAGVVEQESVPRVLALQKPLHLEVGRSRYAVLPYDTLRLSVEIDFEHPAIGRQQGSFVALGDDFRRELAPARTFGLKAWREEFEARGLARGASSENTIVVGDAGPETELRFPDEYVRHKALDLAGDLALVGARIWAHVVAERPGHRGNVELAQAMLRTAGNEESGNRPILDIERILEVIPHRYPFLLVDRIVEFEAGKRIVGLKNVTINEPFFAGHFPGHPIMPGVLIVEAMAQVGGLLLMKEFENPGEKVVYFLSMDDVKFRHPVRPGDQILFELELLQLRGTTCRMRGVGKVDGQPVAEATLMARVMDR